MCTEVAVYKIAVGSKVANVLYRTETTRMSCQGRPSLLCCVAELQCSRFWTHLPIAVNELPFQSPDDQSMPCVKMLLIKLF